VSLRRFLVVTFLSLCAATGASAQNPPNPCILPEQKQFDFWIGEWDVSWPGNQPGETLHATNSIHRILDNCVVEENFLAETPPPLHGKSVSLFDARSGTWKQTWVDNQGSYLDFSGEFKEGQMILARKFTDPKGQEVQQRMVWKDITPKAFDWSWERSEDSGKTWKIVWPLHYERKAENR
jgi:hypothetical protein